MVVRPALVLSVRETETAGPLLWVLMVTNAARPEWRGDIPIPGWKALGLLIPSKVRTTKISTVEAEHARALARLDEHTWRSVIDTIAPALPGMA